MLPPDPSLRRLRGSVLGVAVALLAYGGHVAAGGASVALVDLLPPVLVSAPVCWWLGRRQRSLGSVLALLLGTQAVFHLWFEAAASVFATPRGVAGQMGGMTGDPRLMLAGHVLAAVVTATLLHQGERVLLALLTALAARLWKPVVAELVPPIRRAPARTAAPGVGALAPEQLSDVQSRRGPPAFSAC